MTKISNQLRWKRSLIRLAAPSSRYAGKTSKRAGKTFGYEASAQRFYDMVQLSSRIRTRA